MGESQLIKSFESEAQLVEFAGSFARVLQSVGASPLLFGLRGDLGSGKTTWVRAMLRGLGYSGRVPSPTYTLLEQYDLDGLTLLHLDLYRLAGDSELENLGLRDWLADPRTWVVAEWPERAPTLEQRCDLLIEFADRGQAARQVVLQGVTAAGIQALHNAHQVNFNNNL